jgi:hypothetical protein
MVLRGETSGVDDDLDSGRSVSTVGIWGIATVEVVVVVGEH